MQPNYPAAPAANPFADPSLGGAGGGLKIRDLEGRTVVMIPTAYDPTAKGIPTRDNPNPTQEQITADVFVLDGGPVRYGSNLQQGTPDLYEVATPYYATGVLVSNVNIVRALKPHVGGGIVLGRIERGITKQQGNSRPWNLSPLTDTMPEHVQRQQGVTPDQVARDRQARQAAADLWSARTMGSFVNPQPTELRPVPTPAIPQSWTPAPQYQMSAPAPAGPAMPANWNPTVWAQLSPEQQAQIAASQPGAATVNPMNQPTGF